MTQTRGVSDKLQAENLDICSGCDRVDELVSVLHDLRNESRFELFYNSAVEVCERHNIDGLPQHSRPRKLPKRLDEQPGTASDLNPVDSLRTKFYLPVSRFGKIIIFTE